MAPSSLLSSSNMSADHLLAPRTRKNAPDSRPSRSMLARAVHALHKCGRSPTSVVAAKARKSGTWR
eukprot:11972674-Alexandrium_andersonii.AAC.1